MFSLTAAALMVGGAAAPLPSLAQDYGYGPYGEPLYETWQPEWNQDRFDKHHVILGTVANFTPYRLTVMRRNGNVQTVDLKNGTVIRPTGAMRPHWGEHAGLLDAAQQRHVHRLRCCTAALMILPADAPPALTQVAQRYEASSRGVVGFRMQRIFDAQAPAPAGVTRN